MAGTKAFISLSFAWPSKLKMLVLKPVSKTQCANEQIVKGLAVHLVHQQPHQESDDCRNDEWAEQAACRHYAEVESDGQP